MYSHGLSHRMRTYAAGDTVSSSGLLRRRSVAGGWRETGESVDGEDDEKHRMNQGGSPVLGAIMNSCCTRAPPGS